MTEYPAPSSQEKPFTAIVRDFRHPAFRSTERVVLFALASRIRKDQLLIYSSMATIAGDAGLDESVARRVMNWFVEIGIVVEVPDPTRSVKVRRIDFEALGSLDASIVRTKKSERMGGVVRAPSPAQNGGSLAQNTPFGMLTPPAQDTQGGVQNLVPPAQNLSGGVLRTPKINEDQIRPSEDQFAARAPRRSNELPGLLFELDQAPSNPSTPTPIPAPPTVRPAALAPAHDLSLVQDPTPPVKGKGRAGPKVAGRTTKPRTAELSPEQVITQRRVSDFFYAEFERARGEKPALDWKGRDRLILNKLLEKLDWDGDRACAIMANAFRNRIFVENKCTIAELFYNTTQYQGTPKTARRVSSGQHEPDGFWTMED